jgi:hypothetical protein
VCGVDGSVFLLLGRRGDGVCGALLCMFMLGVTHEKNLSVVEGRPGEIKIPPFFTFTTNILPAYFSAPLSSPYCASLSRAVEPSIQALSVVIANIGLLRR